MHRKYLLLGLCVFLFPFAVRADMTERSGLAYTAKSPTLEEQGDELRTLTYARPDATPVEDPHVTEQTAPGQQPKEETPADKAWEKYKALAAGLAKDEPASAPAAPAAAAQQPAQESLPVGLAGILQEYQKSKAARSDMHTLVITPETPQAPQAPTPPQTPEVAKPE